MSMNAKAVLGVLLGCFLTACEGDRPPEYSRGEIKDALNDIGAPEGVQTAKGPPSRYGDASRWVVGNAVELSSRDGKFSQVAVSDADIKKQGCSNLKESGYYVKLDGNILFWLACG